MLVLTDIAVLLTFFALPFAVVREADHFARWLSRRIR